MQTVKDAAVKHGITFIFNAIYSSELNPIEYLWNLAKRAFRRDLIVESNYKNQALITKLVRDAILGASEDALCNWIKLCVV